MPTTATLEAGGRRKRKRKSTAAKKKVRPSTEKRRVWKGKATKTSSGLKKSQLVKNKHGKIVSAKKSKMGKANSWVRSVSKARKEMGIVKFMPVRKGTALYRRAKEIHEEMKMKAGR